MPAPTDQKRGRVIQGSYLSTRAQQRGENRRQLGNSVRNINTCLPRKRQWLRATAATLRDRTFIKRGAKCLPPSQWKCYRESHSHHFKQMKKDCEAEGIDLPKNIMVNNPQTHFRTPQQYLNNIEEGTMPPMRNHNVLKELAEKNPAGKTKFMMIEFRDFKRLSPPKTPGLQNHK